MRAMSSDDVAAPICGARSLRPHRDRDAQAAWPSTLSAADIPLDMDAHHHLDPARRALAMG